MPDVIGDGSSTEPFLRGLRIAVLVIGSTVLFTFSMVRSIPLYNPLWPQLVAFATLAAVSVTEIVLVTRRASWGVCRWPAVVCVLFASALATFTLPDGAVTTASDWAFGTVGWFGLILLLDQPLAFLACFLALQELIQVTAVITSNVTGLAEVLNLITGSLGPIGLPLACGIAAAVLKQLAGTAEVAAREAADIRTADELAAQRHAQQRRQYADLDDGVIPLLRGLADRTLNPDDRSVQRACAIEASRMRRLFAETDIVRTPLLHELRHCVDIADRRGVLVELHTSGNWAEPPLDIRRALTDGPLAALATAETWARVTVVGTPGAVAVTAVADSGQLELPPMRHPSVRVITGLDRQVFLVEAKWAP